MALSRPAHQRVTPAVGRLHRGEKMKIRYAKALGIISIIIGLIFLCSTLMVLGSSYGVIVFLSGVFSIYSGVVYLTKPYFFVHDNMLEVYAITGHSIATYNLQSLQEIEIENNKLFLNQNGKRSKIPISAWMVDKRDWLSLVQKISDAS